MQPLACPQPVLPDVVTGRESNFRGSSHVAKPKQMLRRACFARLRVWADWELRYHRGASVHTYKPPRHCSTPWTVPTLSTQTPTLSSSMCVLTVDACVYFERPSGSAQMPASVPQRTQSLPLGDGWDRVLEWAARARTHKCRYPDKKLKLVVLTLMWTSGSRLHAFIPLTTGGQYVASIAFMCVQLCSSGAWNVQK